MIEEIERTLVEDELSRTTMSVSKVHQSQYLMSSSRSMSTLISSQNSGLSTGRSFKSAQSKLAEGSVAPRHMKSWFYLKEARTSSKQHISIPERTSSDIPNSYQSATKKYSLNSGLPFSSCRRICNSSIIDKTSERSSSLNALGSTVIWSQNGSSAASAKTENSFSEINRKDRKQSFRLGEAFLGYNGNAGGFCGTEPGMTSQAIGTLRKKINTAKVSNKIASSGHVKRIKRRIDGDEEATFDLFDKELWFRATCFPYTPMIPSD